MAPIELSTPLTSLVRTPPRILSRLTKLGITTVRDLLWHFPTRYEDYRQVYAIADLEPGQQATIHGTIQSVELRRSWRRHMVIVEATIEDETGTIRALWFNQPYLKQTLRVGRIGNFAGKVSISDGELTLSHPTYEFSSPNEHEHTHTGRLVPIYPETQGLTSKGIRFLTQPLIKSSLVLHEWIPDYVLQAHELPDIHEALESIHFPERLADAERARRRFAFEDLFLLQLFNIRQRASLATEKAASLSPHLERVRDTLQHLPFELTASQKQTLWDIAQDLERTSPMNRLLQGDVGSGKTVVAALAALIAHWNGYQTAFMAPTEVLARQHFATLAKLFRLLPEQPTIGLIAAGGARIRYEHDLETEISRQAFKEKISRGVVAIAVGTHALIAGSTKNPPATFRNLALVIVDEQHRFGVRQRAALTEHHARTASHVPHFLSMSATPIPRTLTLTLFGDLDLSVITELPRGRKPITTRIVPAEKRSAAYAFVRKQVSAGRQVFVICPRIEQSPETPARDFLSLDVASVTAEFQKLTTQIFPDLRIGMLHGKLKSKEKEAVMHAFANHTIDILVATSVIEVGVDVPNATVMIIEGSDRFGLAQLYQFRGRVGRGEHQSYCLLFTDATTKSTHERLGALLKARNGFELAEKDLALRGPGEFLGTTQSGFPDMLLQGLRDPRLIQESKAAAALVLKHDPAMHKAPELVRELRRFEERIHLE